MTDRDRQTHRPSEDTTVGGLSPEPVRLFSSVSCFLDGWLPMHFRLFVGCVCVFLCLLEEFKKRRSLHVKKNTEFLMLRQLY